MRTGNSLRRVKARLRAEMLNARAALSADYRAEASRAVVARIRQLPIFHTCRAFLACFPFRGEVDISPLIHEPGEGRAVYLPRADFSTSSLALCRYPCALTRTAFGLTEPAPHVTPATEAELAALDIAIIPGVAFAVRTCHRLGYGGGFFDAFLTAHDVVSIGVAFRCQLAKEVPHSGRDIPMDWVVCEDDVLRRPWRGTSPLRRMSEP